MLSSAFLLSLAIRCALDTGAVALQSTPPQSTPPAVLWLAPLDGAGDQPVWLRSPVIPPPVPSPTGSGYPTRIYACDTSGAAFETIATPTLRVVLVAPGAR